MDYVCMDFFTTHFIYSYCRCHFHKPTYFHSKTQFAFRFDLIQLFNNFLIRRVKTSGPDVMGHGIRCALLRIRISASYTCITSGSPPTFSWHAVKQLEYCTKRRYTSSPIHPNRWNSQCRVASAGFSRNLWSRVRIPGSSWLCFKVCQLVGFTLAGKSLTCITGSCPTPTGNLSEIIVC